jgi:hypothetical protein
MCRPGNGSRDRGKSLGARYFDDGGGMDRPADWPYIVACFGRLFAKLKIRFAKLSPKMSLYQRHSWGMVKWYPIGLRDNPLELLAWFCNRPDLSTA